MAGVEGGRPRLGRKELVYGIYAEKKEQVASALRIFLTWKATWPKGWISLGVGQHQSRALNFLLSGSIPRLFGMTYSL